MRHPDRTLPRTAVCAELRALAVNPAAVPSYRSLVSRTQDGVIPIVFVGGRYEIRYGDLPKIAELFGIQLRKEAA